MQHRVTRSVILCLLMNARRYGCVRAQSLGSDGAAGAALGSLWALHHFLPLRSSLLLSSARLCCVCGAGSAVTAVVVAGTVPPAFPRSCKRECSFDF